MTNFYNNRTVAAARKERRCWMCREPIDIGSSYERLTGSWDGEFYSNAVHPECWDEYSSWGIDEWESFCPGEMERPSAVDTKP